MLIAGSLRYIPCEPDLLLLVLMSLEQLLLQLPVQAEAKAALMRRSTTYAKAKNWHKNPIGTHSSSYGLLIS